MADVSKITDTGGTQYTIKDATARAGLETKAPLDSPALTGTPTAPTASADTNNTQIATTAFVKTAVGPLHSKTYTDVIGTANNWANATFFFGTDYIGICLTVLWATT